MREITTQEMEIVGGTCHCTCYVSGSGIIIGDADNLVQCANVCKSVYGQRLSGIKCD